MNFDQKLLQQILLNIPNAVFWKDHNLVYRGCNYHFAHFVGFATPEGIIGKSDDEMPWGLHTANIYQEEDKKILATGEKILDKEVPMIKGDEYRILVVSKIPLYDENKQIVGILGIYFDITERKKNEQSLRTAKEKAETANRAKSEFLASMSHDLRTPLNAVLGMAQVLENSRTYPEQLEYIAAIIQAGNTLLRLIEDVLSFSKIEADKLEVIQEPFDLQQLVEEVISMMLYQAVEKKIELIAEYCESVPRFVIGDSHCVRRILINLIGNAIKFTDKGYVYVSVQTAEMDKGQATLHFIIEDTGIGIPQDKLELIFDRFSRVEPSYKSRHTGAGLGLAIVKQLADILSGSIHVNSRLGQGSHFKCTIPFILQDLARKESHWQTLYADKLRVLVVDDNALRGSVIRKQLAVRESAQVKSKMLLNALREAWNLNYVYDIIILDDDMVECDVLDMAVKIHAEPHYEKALLILMSKPTTLAQIEKIKKAGFATRLIKPVQPSELINIMTSIWERWSLSDQKKPQWHNYSQPLVLLVEDDKLAQRVSTLLLENLGCKVDLAIDGKQVLEKIDNEYDVIFMDIGLPDNDGLSLAKQLRNSGREAMEKVPIIALTAHVLEEDKQTCFTAGMNNFLTKPLIRDELHKILKELKLIS